MKDQRPSDSPYEFAPKPEPAQPAAAAMPDDAQREMDIERTCPHCGFRIVGKPHRGRCPECAAALDEVATDLLQFSDAAWLKRASNGVLLLAGTLVIHVLAIVVGWMGEWKSGTLIHGIAGIAAAAGVWMATAPEPAVGLGRTPLAPLARLIALAVGGLWGAAIFVGQSEPVEGRIDSLTVAPLLAMALMALVVALHLRTLAVRVPNDSLAGQFLNVGFIGLGTCVLLAGLHMMEMVDAKHLMYSFFCSFPMIGGMAVVVVWASWTLVRMGFELRNCASAGQTIVARQALRAQAARAKR